MPVVCRLQEVTVTLLLSADYFDKNISAFQVLNKICKVRQRFEGGHMALRVQKLALTTFMGINHLYLGAKCYE
jgi:hypothetical protein